MSNNINTEVSNISAVDLVVRVAVGMGAVLFGVLMVMRRSGETDVFGRYSLEYAVLLLAYTPLLFCALFFAFRSGGVVGAIRPVLSLRLFQVGVGLLCLVMVPLFIRYLQTGNGLEAIRIIAMLFLLASYVLYAFAIAGRSGVARLRHALIGLAIVVGTALATLSVTVSLIAMRTGEVADVVTLDEFRALQPLVREPDAQFLYPGGVGRIREFRTPITNNSFGYNDRERTIDNPDNRFRILVLGDSYVAALEVPQGGSFAAVLERLLNDGEDRYEVISLGRWGIGQEEETKILRDLGLRFNPHLVILHFVNNDLYDNDPDVKAAYRKFVQTWSSAPRSPRALLFPEFTIDRFMTKRLHALLARYGYLLDRQLSTATIRPDDLVYLSPRPPIAQKALLTTETLLDGIVAELKVRNVKLLLTSRLGCPGMEALLRSHPGLRSFDIDGDFLCRWLREYAESRSESYFDLDEHFDAHLQGGGEPLTWEHDGHWNKRGHEIAAKALYNFLLDSDLLK